MSRSFYKFFFGLFFFRLASLQRFCNLFAFIFLKCIFKMCVFWFVLFSFEMKNFRNIRSHFFLVRIIFFRFYNLFELNRINGDLFTHFVSTTVINNIKRNKMPTWHDKENYYYCITYCNTRINAFKWLYPFFSLIILFALG